VLGAQLELEDLIRQPLNLSAALSSAPGVRAMRLYRKKRPVSGFE
jgi:hypothetical protein